MTRKDRDALKRAMATARRDPGRAAQLDDMLTDRDWEEVAWFAAHVVQGDVLNLKLWERPLAT